MGRGETLLRTAGAVLTILLAIAGCGRNWCAAGFGPCDQFNNMDPKLVPTPTNTNTCGYQTSGNPRNGLMLNYSLPTPTRANSQMTIFVTGGTPPYRVIQGNKFSTLTPVPNSSTSWTFVAGTAASLACFKIVDSTMGDGDQCDACSAQIQIAP